MTRGYMKTDSGWTRYTLAFLSYCDWLERTGKHRADSLNRRTVNKPLAPRNYQVWPVFEAAEKRCDCAWCDWVRTRYPELKNKANPGHVCERNRTRVNG